MFFPQSLEKELEVFCWIAGTSCLVFHVLLGISFIFSLGVSYRGGLVPQPALCAQTTHPWLVPRGWDPVSLRYFMQFKGPLCLGYSIWPTPSSNYHFLW